MFATQCQFCRHENVPGARFCADCGSPLHLKPCPACGKVDDVAAATCYACGAAFPQIDTVAVAGAGPEEESTVNRTPSPGPAEPAHMPPAAGPVRHRSPAWPLVLVALLAGGLPLIWMNRANLPLPQAWRPGSSNEVSRQAAPPTPTLPIRMPPPAGSATPPLDAPAPVAAPTTPSPTVAPSPGVTATPAPAPPPQAAVAPTSPPPEAATKEPPPRKAAQRPKPTPARAADKPKAVEEAPPVRPAPAAQAPSRECTDAVAALGLCDPKKNAK